uniref:Uncharacterized protein n=1 Tax=Bionectria ochroleuca TaxID=29856 RepID=A0A8H7NEI4_BIOOC
MTKPGGANEGWNAPRKSMLLGHLNGLATKATNEEVRISFEPAPGYAGIANAAGGGNPCNEGGEGCGARNGTQGGSGHGAGGHDDGGGLQSCFRLLRPAWVGRGPIWK